MPEQKYKVLIVDDEEDIRVLTGKLLSQEGYMCWVAANGVKALEQLEKRQVDAVITDIKMPGGMDGIELTREINKKYNLPVMVMTGFAQDFTAHDALTAGADDFIIKPFAADELTLRLQKMILQKRN